jgi:ankyrin repeat protein
MPTSDVRQFLLTCAAGDVAAVDAALAADPGLVSARGPDDRTALHVAVRHPEVVRRLLAHGADVNARERGDNVTPLHLAAAQGAVESVRALLDAGADVDGAGDLHEGGVIGWAVGSHDTTLIDMLLERGARHHVFSAMALRDRALVRQLVQADPAAVHRRRSRFENRQTPVHASFAAPDGVGHLAGTPDYEMLALLISLGADVDAPDDRGRTPLDVAMLRGDVAAMRLLHAAGARQSDDPSGNDGPSGLGAKADTVSSGEPMFSTNDMRGLVRWYEALGFRLTAAHEDDGELTFARLSLGACAFGLTPGDPGTSRVSLWVMTSDVRGLYALARSLQLAAAARALGADDVMQFPFDEDLYEPFYGGQQFSIRDPAGRQVVFYQSAASAPTP